MFLVIAGFVGLLAALLIHWLTWTRRRKAPAVTVVAGALGALGLTGFCLLFLTSEIANMMLIVLAVFWGVALVIGYLQARSLAVPWWKGVLAVFFEMALAFLAGAAVNLTLQRFIPWFGEHYPGVDVYAVISTYLWVMVIALLVLAVIRPILGMRLRAE